MLQMKKRYCPQKIQKFTAFEDWLSRIPHTVLTWPEKAVFARMKRFGLTTGEIFPTPKALSTELGIEERTVLRILKSLEDKDFIERERHSHAPSRFFLVENAYIPVTAEDEVSQSTELSIDSFVNRQIVESQSTELSVGTLGSEERNIREKEELSVGSHASESEPNPQDPEEDLQLEDPIEVFARNLYSRKRRVRVRFERQQDLPILERLRAKERFDGPVECRRALVEYLADNSDWCHQNRWPIEGFLKRGTSYNSSSAAHHKPQSESRPHGDGAVGHSPPYVASSSANCVPLGASGLPLPLEIWNRLVPHDQKHIGHWNPHTELHRKLTAAWAEQQFREGLEAICQEAERLHVEFPEQSGWLTFSWMLKTPDNWFKLFTKQIHLIDRAKEAEAQRPAYRSAGAKAIDRALEKLRAQGVKGA
jgi:DNA-binding transcriptional regulator YhcF (GntR family)